MMRRLEFCRRCNARDRAIVAGRCIVCDRPPREVPAEPKAQVSA